MKLRPAKNLIALWLKWYGAWAITLPPFGIYVLPGREYDWLIRHERKHEEQALRLGLLKFYLLYLYYQLRYGYENNPLEREARDAEYPAR